MKRTLMGALAALVLFCATPARADYVITFDGGGVITDFFEKFTAIRQAGGNVVIDGPCISACTLVLTQIEPEHVCITRRAILGFHSASARGEFSSDGTGLMWFSYPLSVRQWLTDKGWDGTTAHPELIWMDNETLGTIFKTCHTQGAND